MAPQIVLSRDFDIKNVTFSEVKVLDNGGKIVYISYNRAPLIIQTPAMAAPFGMSRWEGENGAASKYSIDLSFKGMDDSSSMQAFYKLLEHIDEKMISHGFDNQQTWFKGKRYGSREIVEALYTPLIKHAKDRHTGERTDAYPPTFKATVPQRDGAFACDVFDASRASVDLNAIDTKGARITAIIQCTGVWFAGGKFGVSWKVVQMKVSQNSTKLTGYALVDVDDDEGDAPTVHENERVVMMSDEDDESDEKQSTMSTRGITAKRGVAKPAARPLTVADSAAAAPFM